MTTKGSLRGCYLASRRKPNLLQAGADWIFLGTNRRRPELSRWRDKQVPHRITGFSNNFCHRKAQH